MVKKSERSLVCGSCLNRDEEVVLQFKRPLVCNELTGDHFSANKQLVAVFSANFHSSDAGAVGEKSVGFGLFNDEDMGLSLIHI